VTLHAHSIQETGCIRRLVSLLNAKTGEPSKQRPRCLLKVGSTRLQLPETLCNHNSLMYGYQIGHQIDVSTNYSLHSG
jgi:hypothetical protein